MDGELTNEEVAAAIGFEKGEMVRRYRGGLAMPRKDKLAKLADLMGLSPAQLQFPDERKEQTLAGMLGDAVDVSPDEQNLLKAYRKMSGTARKALRAHAVRLLEQHGAKDADNPFGKAGTN